MQKLQDIYINKEVDLLTILTRFSKSFKYTSILTSNDYEDRYGKYNLIAAFGAFRIFEADEAPFEKLKQFYDESPSWLFGHFSYDLKNKIENLSSRNESHFNFSLINFFEPAYMVIQPRNSKQVEFWYNEGVNKARLNNLIVELQTGENEKPKAVKLPEFKSRISNEEYIEAVEALQGEIRYGNIYEVNFCQEFYADDVEMDSFDLFLHLNKRSPMPFAAYYRLGGESLICASPERFLCKKGSKIVAQPIKGTAKRDLDDVLDNQIKQSLKDDLKEQTENVMIVDLVRNDLSRTAVKSSVKVEELFGAYTFPSVHQLISTVSSQLKDGVHFIDVIEKSFPMGSMTGAPKVSAMQIIDRYEASRRELYSGSVGYITPGGDFDFNVVIRSFLYSEIKKRLSYTVGGAITHLSDPHKEYEECLLKAKAIFEP